MGGAETLVMETDAVVVGAAEHAKELVSSRLHSRLLVPLALFLTRLVLKGLMDLLYIYIMGIGSAGFKIESKMHGSVSKMITAR